TGAISAVRARGLMLAVELDARAGPARPVCDRLREHGILAKDTHGQTIRIAPPLVVDADTVDWALDRFATVLGAL
ncbi:MAG: aminotransferase class III-fold pyridoxal phosphate-dependent enzyme, partial [Gluconacetobacter diazotrophicus]|nr:aminotransferase class III-fold pyridoxal phosphate-dependent enzyme [Gluconacetobacter diazotrophicus]